MDDTKTDAPLTPEELRRERDAAREHLALVGEELARAGCDCDCEHHSEEHDEDCERCLACRIARVLSR